MDFQGVVLGRREANKARLTHFMLEVVVAVVFYFPQLLRTTSYVVERVMILWVSATAALWLQQQFFFARLDSSLRGHCQSFAVLKQAMDFCVLCVAWLPA